MTRLPQPFAALRELAACAAAVCLACAAFQSAARADTTVRVLLAAGQTQAVIASPGGLVVAPLLPGAAPLLAPEVTTVLDVQPHAGGLLLAGAIGAPDRLLVSPLGDVALTVNGQAYRGSILLRRDAFGALSVIDVVDLEEYLFSVVGSEVSASTPRSALQAQAVVARTYAVSRLGSHEDLGFDLWAGDQDQAYNGIQAESQPVVDAVEATHGVVMLYGNSLAHSYYSACDGGYTSDGHALRDPQPYLQAVRDPYCPMSPYMQWSAAVPVADFVAALDQRGLFTPPLAQSDLLDVRAGTTDASGRLQTVTLLTRRGSLIIAGTDFRAGAGNRLVKSTRITSVSLSGGAIHATGAGYGHGVGMCQLGARGMAEAGLGVYAILDFYYPGALLTQLASYERNHAARTGRLEIATGR